MEVFIRYETVLYLTKTFVVETLYYCNPLCYVKCLTSLLTLYIVKMHFINVNHIERDRYIVVSCLSQGHAAPTVAPPFLPVEGRTPSSCCSQRLGLARRMYHHMSEEGPVFLCVHLSEFMTLFCTHTCLHWEMCACTYICMCTYRPSMACYSLAPRHCPLAAILFVTYVRIVPAAETHT